MVFIILSLLCGGVVVETGLLNGEQLRGELRSLTTEGVSLGVDGTTRSFERQQLRDVRFPEQARRDERLAAVVQLVDGSLVTVDSVAWAEGQLKANRQGSTWTAPVLAVRAIRLLLAGDANDAQWNEILAKVGQEDLLVIRREQNLDYLAGLVVGLDEESVQFEYAGRTIPVPFSRAAGVILAKRSETLPPPRLLARGVDGSQWNLESCRLEGEAFRMVTVAKVAMTVPLEWVSRLEFPELEAVYLADLEPTSVVFEPFFPSDQIGEALAALAAPQVNRSFDGELLSIRDASSVSGRRQFRNGLAIQSRTELVYRLAAKFQRFRATVGLDPAGAALGSAELVIMADEKEIARRTVAANEPPCELDLDVTGARRMTILVDYGAHLDIGDRVHLGDARLSK